MSTPANGQVSPHPRWLSIVLSLLLSGSSHFLSGKKWAGLCWFLLVQFFYLGALVTTVSSRANSSMLIIALWLVALVAYVLMIIHGCKKPIQQVSPGMWAAFCALVLIVPLVKISVTLCWICRPFLMPTASMQPTLMGIRKSAEGQTIGGDHIIVDKYTYHLRLPARGDIAVFRTEGIPEVERERFGIPANQYYVKRVVGLPGEKISVHATDIYVNGQKLSDPNIIAHIAVSSNVPPDLMHRMLPDKEVQLGANEYFVVGDNILNSLDSRYFGAIKYEFILGRVTRIFWPPERCGVVQ